MDIDVVYTWVDGSDPSHARSLREHLARAARAPTEADAGPHRFADHGELRYSLRALARHAPWVRHVYLVTNGQRPEWLDVSGGRVSLVTHREIFANPADLPTFSSTAIELHLHRIAGLSERYVYLNDDVVLGTDVTPDDFFAPGDGAPRIYLADWFVPAEGAAEIAFADGRTKPLTAATEATLGAWLGSMRTSARLLDGAFGRRPRRALDHVPVAYHRDAVLAWQARWPDAVAATAAQRFRRHTDVLGPFVYAHFLMEQGAAGGDPRLRCELGEPHAGYLLDVASSIDHLDEAFALFSARPRKFLTFQCERAMSADAAVRIRAAMERRYPVPSPYERR